MEPPNNEPIEDAAAPSEPPTPPEDPPAGPSDTDAPADAPPAEAAEPTTPPTEWQTAADAAAGSVGWRGAGSVVGRALDTFGSAFPLFVGLSLPTAIFAALSGFATASPAASLLASLMTALTGLVSGAAMMFAADDLGRGAKPDLASVLDRAAGRAIPLLLATLAIVIVVGGLVFLAVLGAVIVSFADALGTPAARLGVFSLLTIVAGVLLVFLGMRWAVSTPAVVLGGQGPLGGLNRSWELTRGHVWRLFGLYFALGLLLLLGTAGASLLSAFAPQRALGGLGLAIFTLLASPLAVIALAIVYRDLSGWPEGAGTGVPRGQGRRTAIVAVIGGGFLVFAAGIWAVSNAGGQVFLPDRGHVIAGTSQNALSPCRPNDVKTTFSATDDVWVAAIFTKHVPAGDSVIVEYFRDGTSLGSAPLTAGSKGLDCYYETAPIKGAQPATYRITVTYASVVIADGTFTVQ